MKIQIEALAKSFGSVRAVDQVSFTVKPGELFFLLGPSGCGKTTLLRIVAGLETADAGTIHFGDRLMNRVSAQHRNAAMVFQHYALWPHMTVAQNVEYGLKIRKLSRSERRHQVAAALETVGMGTLGDRWPGQLSGGQQQRVALARALVVRPDVLLLDEPLSNLDAQLREQMRQEIRTLQKQTGITTLYVTHDQEEAMTMADRIAVIREGRVEQIDPPTRIYRRPANPFVAQFLGEANLIPGTVTAFGAGVCVVQTALGRLEAADLEESFAPNDPVLCMVRPEAVRLIPANGGVECTVASASFAGDRVDYELVGGDGERVRASVSNCARSLAEGARTGIAIDRGDLSVMRR